LGKAEGLEIESFFVPFKWNLADRRVPFGALKTRDFYMLTIRPKGIPICHQCGHRWCTLSCDCEYLREFSKKFEMALMVYSGAWGKLTEVENLVALSL
jgi:hypothetical protein